MQTAWRERNPGVRIKAAKEAITLNAECATAYILLAEEEVLFLSFQIKELLLLTKLYEVTFDLHSQLIKNRRY